VTDGWSRRGAGDDRTPAQRRCDALGEIARRWLDVPERPVVGSERPHVTVTVDLEALEGRAGRRCELDESGSIAPESARRLACDASVSRLITRAPSEPLDVGRRTPVVPAGLRRAVIARDGGCRFPGCDRPSPWCDAHHVVHWADGGETSLANLVLLCRRHHRAVHDGFGLRMADGGPVFTRRDGRPLEDRAPP
jgi:5-methylcytosine-specific restriction endonuclease McrA